MKNFGVVNYGLKGYIGYFAPSGGNITEEIIIEYINNQNVGKPNDDLG